MRSARPVRVHVAALGNAFMTDIAGWLVEAAGQLGRDAELVDDGSLPSDPSTTNLVVAPHELYVLSDASDRDIQRAASISVPVCTEQPGTTWFEMTVGLAGPSPLALDINRHGVDALRERRVDAHHLRLGGVPSMDHRTRADPGDRGDGGDPGAPGGPGGDVTRADRPIDVLFLGGRTDHRAARLAELAPLLWDRRADLRLFSFTRPVRGGVDGLVFGAAKYDLLARSRILLNIHRDGDGPGYFEWARMVEAMANGCAVVTEPSTAVEPLVPGEHFVATADLAAALTELLDDRARCAELGERAATAVLDELPLAATLEPALALADRALEDARVARPRPWAPRHRARIRRAQQHPLLPVFSPNRDLRRDVHAAIHAETELRRAIDRERCRHRHGDPDHVERSETPAYASVEPEVTAIVTLFDYAPLVTGTLVSLAASTDVELEIVVVDDHSADDGRDVVRRFLAARPDLPVLLVGSDVNRGLPASRNLALAHARADKVMVMDADNEVYPTCLRRLADALDADPRAAFAYATLEDFGTSRGVRSAMGWHVPWICEVNHIDAQAMLRRSAWERHGGYRTDDPLLFGWEDWELWLRFAAAGEHGVHVPQILGRYRTQESSMISTSNLFADLMLEHLRELHPTLPWP